MKPQRRIEKITKWISAYAKKYDINALVVGISGGIDSSVVSTLCARSGLYTLVVSMPIRQSKLTHSLSLAHGKWLEENYPNADHYTIDLTKTFAQFENVTGTFSDELAYANSRARLRMMCLYQLAQANNGIVVGTGNRVEDFGVGFFTKYGDGGVDISPIADLMKSEVWALGKQLGVLQDIIDAEPTDGLWADGRTDEGQLGMTYSELERAMIQVEQSLPNNKGNDYKNILKYQELRKRNMHKMLPIPVCKMPDSLL